MDGYLTYAFIYKVYCSKHTAANVHLVVFVSLQVRLIADGYMLYAL